MKTKMLLIAVAAACTSVWLYIGQASAKGYEKRAEAAMDDSCSSTRGWEIGNGPASSECSGAALWVGTIEGVSSPARTTSGFGAEADDSTKKKREVAAIESEALAGVQTGKEVPATMLMQEALKDAQEQAAEFDPSAVIADQE